MNRKGFTLIELLTVIAVLSILMALLFPAYNRMQKRVRAVAATDLCSQVAAAWANLQLDNGRFPSKALLTAQTDGGAYSTHCSATGNDLVFKMSPRIASLLNWWVAPGPVPALDVSKYNPKYAIEGSGVSKGSPLPTALSSYSEHSELWPADARLERSDLQKKFGIFAPWVENRLVDDDGNPLKAFDSDYVRDTGSKSNSDEHAWGYGIVWVMLDLDGDGKLTIPGAFTSDGSDLEISATAAAWVYDEDRQKVLSSWGQ